MPAATQTISLCPEKNAYSANQNVSDEAVRSANFEPNQPLDYGVRHIIIEQNNTSVDYDIPGVGVRSSARFWAGAVKGNKVLALRTIGNASMRAMGFKEKTAADKTAPEILAIQNAEGKWRAERGVDYIHALNDTSFIKGENNRLYITTPVAIIPRRRGNVWTSAFESDGSRNMKHKQNEAGDDILDLTINERFYFYELDKAPTEKEIAMVKEAIQNDPDVRDHAYLR